MKFLKPRKGQGMVEYALIVLAVVIIITLALYKSDNPFKTAITGAFNRTANQINAAGSPAPLPTGGGS